MIKIIDPFGGAMNPDRATVLSTAESFFKADARYLSCANGQLLAGSSANGHALHHSITENPMGTLNVLTILDTPIPIQLQTWVLDELSSSGHGHFTLMDDGRIQHHQGIQYPEHITEDDIAASFCDIVNSFQPAFDALDGDAGGYDGDSGSDDVGF